MKPCSIGQSIIPFVLAYCSLAACGADPTTSDPTSTIPSGTGIASVAPSLKPGVDRAIFLPDLFSGYHPSAEDLDTAGKSCSSSADCATSDGEVVFTCSRPYHGQSQCQGVFPPGADVFPGVSPSCVYYSCPAGYVCAAEAQTRSVTCLPDNSK
jgi:hypothetical protein